MKQIKYENMREQTPFVWYVNSSIYPLAELAGVSLHEMFTDYKASIKMYSKENIAKYNEIYSFGDRIKQPVISTPPVSYGHLNGVGVPLRFPEGNGEVNYERMDWSLDEWIQRLDEKRDFSKEGMMPYFLEYHEKLKQAFPGEKVQFSCVYEGPLTEAYTMLDMDLYYNLYDEPEKLKTMLEKVSQSVIRYKKFHCQVNGTEYKDTSNMCDDCATLVPPDMWEEFVIPNIDMIYADVGALTRSLHSEDMIDKHLKHLETLGITWFDPSVSPKLTPPIITQHSRVPYIWRMASIYHHLLDKELAKDFVYASVRDGASGVFTSGAHLDRNSVEVVEGFIQGCETVEEMLQNGETRTKIGELMSERGKKLFWDQWKKTIGG